VYRYYGRRVLRCGDWSAEDIDSPRIEGAIVSLAGHRVYTANSAVLSRCTDDQRVTRYPERPAEGVTRTGVGCLEVRPLGPRRALANEQVDGAGTRGAIAVSTVWPSRLAGITRSTNGEGIARYDSRSAERVAR